MNELATKVIETAREILRAQGFFVDNLWHVDDIHFICEQRGLDALRDEEAMEVFAIANEQFDGEIGLSWPQLEKALTSYLRRRLVLSVMLNRDDAL